MRLNKRIHIAILILTTVILFSGCKDEKEQVAKETQLPVKTDKEEVAAENIYEKGYHLPVDASEKSEAEQEGKAMMEKIQSIYEKCDKGTAINTVVSEKTIRKIVNLLESTLFSVTYDDGYGDMRNYETMETFLTEAIKGKEGTATVYEVHGDGGLSRDKFIFDGKDMYVLHTIFSWSDNNKPLVGSSDYTRIKEWKYTKNGWFLYEYCVPEPPEVTEIVNGSCLIRVKPMTKKNRKFTEKCVRGLGYQGNNLLCSNWDTEHMENLDYNGIYEYLYSMKYKKRFSADAYPDGIPKNEFENLIMEYLPIAAKEIQKYAVFDTKKQTYVWERLGCFNYELTYFGESIPEVTNIRENKDGTVVLTVNAVCEMFLCDDAVITHQLTVQFRKDGSFQYLGNKILNDGISNIPNYQYRVSKKK